MSGETGSSGSPIGSSATPVGPPQFLSVVDSLAARASNGGIADPTPADQQADASGVPATTHGTEPAAPEAAPEPEPVLLLEPRDGLPPVIDADEPLREAERALAGGSGPVAVDAERASGYRYGQRAYLVQLRREGAGTFLIDPIAFTDLAPLQEALEGTEWVLHAASQDLPCLAEIGLRPTSVFDTELAGRLTGHERVGLGPL